MVICVVFSCLERWRLCTCILSIFTWVLKWLPFRRKQKGCSLWSFHSWSVSFHSHGVVLYYCASSWTFIALLAACSKLQFIYTWLISYFNFFSLFDRHTYLQHITRIFYMNIDSLLSFTQCSLLSHWCSS